MKKQIQLKAIKKYVYHLFHDDVTGHDYYHMERVAKTAKEIAQYENANVFICEMAAWVHDVGDKKLTANPAQSLKDLNEFLFEIDMEENEVMQVNQAIKDISFSKGNRTPVTLEGKVVQDADRIDALGAIGIARTFAYGGANSQLIYDPSQEEETSIQHFYDKLLQLKDSFNTSKGKEFAENRHEFMVSFLKQFHEEWNAKTSR